MAARQGICEAARSIFCRQAMLLPVPLGPLSSTSRSRQRISSRAAPYGW
jgi:hypothetical protein